MLEAGFSFPNLLSEFVYTRTYSRWLEEEKRRETWPETVSRYVNFIFEGRNVPPDLKSKAYEAILNFDVLPSMRALWCAGDAMTRDNTCGYNCSFLPIDNLKAFSEALFILMNGTGVGYSVERTFTNNLPLIAPPTGNEADYTIADSTEGWADAVFFGITAFHRGDGVKFHYDKIRAKGARLKMKGGRASGPEPLKRVLDFAAETIAKAAGRRLKPIEAHDILCMIAEIVMVGGFRRASLISFSDPDDMEMRHAKDWSQGEFPAIRYMANNSAFYEEKPSKEMFDREWAALVASNAGERGFYVGSSPRRDKRGGEFRSNPCLTGDTLVSVADGRGAVSFKALAEADEDVPVYCYDDKKRVQVRWMRAPRKTGEKVQVFRVTLDDGSVVRATANHRFTTREGAVKRVDQLQSGDRLQVLTRYLSSFSEQISPREDGTYEQVKSQDYWWVTGGWKQARQEHRYVSEFHTGRPLTHAETVHHRDHNGQNNSPSNLEVLLKGDHDRLHIDRMLGDRNPMRRAASEWSDEKWASYRSTMSLSVSSEKNGRYSGFTHEELKGAVDLLTRRLGRQATKLDWVSFAKAGGYPVSFSAWRRQTLGDIPTFLRASSERCGFGSPINADARVIRRYYSLLQSGYNVKVVDGGILFEKNCETCGGSFETTRREHGLCSVACGRKTPTLGSDSWDDKIRVYNLLKFSNSGLPPARSGWAEKCREEEILPNLRNLSWEKFEARCADANHIVVSVEPDGFEDVFNGTVDEFHNFFVGGFESLTKTGKRKIQFVNTLNCGEILLRFRRALDPWTGEGGGGQFCNLTAAVTRSHDTLETMCEKVKIATWIGSVQSSYSHFPYLRPAWAELCAEDRLLGVDITGQRDNPSLSSDEDAMSFLNATARATAIIAADAIGISRPAAVTCGKPSGNSSQFVDCASGFHNRHAKFYHRHVRISAKDPLFRLIKDFGVPVFKENGQDHLDDDAVDVWVARFPVKAPETAKTRHDEKALDMLERYLQIMRTWCGDKGHNQSATIYVREEEWTAVGEWLYKNFDEVTGLSFLPFDGGNYKLAPYEELTEEEYLKSVAAMPNVNFRELSFYETMDEGNGSQEPACVGGTCEV